MVARQSNAGPCIVCYGALAGGRFRSCRVPRSNRLVAPILRYNAPRIYRWLVEKVIEICRLQFVRAARCVECVERLEDRERPSHLRKGSKVVQVIWAIFRIFLRSVHVVAGMCAYATKCRYIDHI
ncbi:hypothetical protein PsYK624_076240 [Phanerochaete sordida]|uniref:Uncharacterized protein n=1 Tax=Phanerochaete sordida TaxID=48140 RepID=A0A9P3GCT4_9APHY|nr:hypothetical protein PsYK624_076240 [Phanerochaete sordida]